MDAEKRLLKIKTGSVVRLKKELGLYEQEKETEAQRVARMKEEGADVHDIKHAVGFRFLRSQRCVNDTLAGAGFNERGEASILFQSSFGRLSKSHGDTF